MRKYVRAELKGELFSEMHLLIALLCSTIEGCNWMLRKSKLISCSAFVPYKEFCYFM